jgi:hypothetical protein
MFVEKLEDRRLFSAAPLLHALKTSPASVLLEEVEAKLETEPVLPATFVLAVSGHQTLSEGGSVALAPHGEELNQLVHPGSAAAAAATGAVGLESSLTGAFDPSIFLGPFPSTFNFVLNKKNPLNLFNISRSASGEKLLFTGKLNKSLTQLSGVLHVTGPNERAIFTYTATFP